MADFASLTDRYFPALLDGALVTLQLASITWLGGLVFGATIGIWRASRMRERSRMVTDLAVLALSSVPVMVYLLWVHYPLQSWLGVQIPPFYTAAITFTIYNSLAVGEIVAGAIREVPIAYQMAARVGGVPRALYLRTVVVPLATRAALPSYLVSQVTALHLTLFASLISVDELFRAVQRINALEYDAVSIYSLLVIFYFGLSLPLLVAAKWASRKFPVGQGR
jgi:polar amino acid transport system permease protein